MFVLFWQYFFCTSFYTCATQDKIFYTLIEEEILSILIQDKYFSTDRTVAEYLHVGVCKEVALDTDQDHLPNGTKMNYIFQYMRIQHNSVSVSRLKISPEG